WDGETFERLQVIRDFGEEPGALAFSPDGKTLAVGGREMRLAQFDTATGRNLGFLHQGNNRAYGFQSATFNA
ncbi:MAG: hypothetical protein GTO53_10565, partial [Planctomycetales bacterium]|nr:hypothetical protein [Planctomycetales bacterium]NIM09564.1 hypothetical protein [Planctomycetales bacterium]NIN09052.1 hypothetical protein [Planctomycetales bacterium]NIN78165.1 hypothetical protein [Planctomycetales bacterium]NIO35350.1 hypothetical protein [Planctomycetales bacterium]